MNKDIFIRYDGVTLKTQSNVDAFICGYSDNKLIFKHYVERGSSHIFNNERQLNIDRIECFGFFKNGKQKKRPIRIDKINTLNQ